MSQTKTIVALQMDAIESINVATDSTFLIGLEAQKRGFKLFYYQPQDLILKNDGLFARGFFIKFYENSDTYFEKEEKTIFPLNSAQFIWVRQDPPFDMGYITATYLLEQINTQCLILNNPKSIRDFPEKVIPFHFQEFMPPSCIGRDPEMFQSFFEEHQDVILKPLYGAKGQGVIRLKDKENLGGAHDLFCALEKTPYIMQTFIPEVAKGDKRILFVDGEVIGAFKRIPQKGQIRSNIVLGGTAELCDLTPREEKLALALKPFLKEHDLFLAGIDVIGDYLTEVNVTSPTGYALLNRLTGGKSQNIIWDKALAKRKAKQMMSID